MSITKQIYFFCKIFNERFFLVFIFSRNFLINKLLQFDLKLVFNLVKPSIYIIKYIVQLILLLRIHLLKPKHKYQIFYFLFQNIIIILKLFNIRNNWHITKLYKKRISMFKSFHQSINYIFIKIVSFRSLNLISHFYFSKRKLFHSFNF